MCCRGTCRRVLALEPRCAGTEASQERWQIDMHAVPWSEECYRRERCFPAAAVARPRVPESIPVRLDRRRVYVLPTRFGLFFAALLVAMLLGALNYNNNPALLLALLLGATGLASLVVAHLQLSGLAIDAVSAEPVNAGGRLGLHLSLSADDARARRGLQLQCREAHAVASLQASDPAAALLELQTSRRGWYDTGRIRISTTQPMGLALAWAWVWPRCPCWSRPPRNAGPHCGGDGNAGQHACNRRG